VAPASVYKNIHKYYDQIFPLKNTRVEFLSNYLKDKYPSILDIGCATGELAIALSKLGYSVTAMDLHKDMVKAGQLKADNQGNKVSFLVKDMLKVAETFSQNSFNAALCFGNTLPHLRNFKEITDFFLGLKEILKTRGIFFLQLVNFQRILREGLKALPKLENETFIFERKYNYDEKEHRIEFKTSLFIKKRGKYIKGLQFLYPITAEELKRALTNTGFSKYQFLENENSLPFTESSPGLIAIAYKD
jgi:2-polyprenyl-3-methyl-5-hydroxy-6-metoxy-1,4-benzoquinol methylase